MATAKRVKQDAKTVPTRVFKAVKLVLLSSLDGKTTNEEVLKTDGEWVKNTKLVPQEDRIVLELSLDEARNLRRYLGKSNSSDDAVDTWSAYLGLNGVLSPDWNTGASSNQGAQQADAKPTSGANPSEIWYDKTRYPGPSTPYRMSAQEIADAKQLVNKSWDVR